MASGSILMGFGAALWLFAYYLPSQVDWSRVPRPIQLGRNRPGELIGRWLGPALVIGGLIQIILELRG